MLPPEMFMHIISYISDPVTKIRVASTSKDMRSLVAFDSIVDLKMAKKMSQEFMYSDLVRYIRELAIIDNKKIVDIRHLTNLERLYCRRSILGSDGIAGLPVRHLELETLEIDNKFHGIDKIYNLPQLKSLVHDKKILTDYNVRESVLCALALLMVILIFVSLAITTILGVPYLIVGQTICQQTTASFTPEKIVTIRPHDDNCNSVFLECTAEASNVINYNPCCNGLCERYIPQDIYIILGHINYSITDIEYRHKYLITSYDNIVAKNRTIYYDVNHPEIYKDTNCTATWPLTQTILRFQMFFAPIAIILVILFGSLSCRRTSKNLNVIYAIEVNKLKPKVD